MALPIITFFQRFCTPRVFQDWALEYENDVAAHHYSAARMVAQAALPLIAPGQHITDLGIGTGLVAKALKKHEKSLLITGLDLSPAMLALCQEAQVADRLYQIDVGKEDWPLESTSQDMVLAAGLFEYLTEPMVHHVIGQTSSCLKQGGFFIFAYLPAEKDKPVTKLWDGKSGKIFSCAYPPSWMEGALRKAGYEIISHHENFTGSVFADGSSYDYRLIVAKRA